MAKTDIIGNSLEGQSGTGAYAGTTSPDFTTPNLGTPSAISLNNATAGTMPLATIANGTDGEIPTWDASGVITTVATGNAGEVLTSQGAGLPPVFATVSGSGTVNAGTTNELAWYASDGTEVSGLTTGNNGVLVTDGSGVPSISSTIPSATQDNITRLGTIASIGAPLGGAYGGTGVNNGSSTMTVGGDFAMSGSFTFAGTLTANTAVTFPTSGTLATTSQIPTGAALTKTDDTNVTVTLGGNDSTALVNAASITMGWTGTLGISRGGTGLGTTPTAGQLLIGNNTNFTLATLTAGANIAIDNSTPGAITISTSGGSGYVWSVVTGTSQAMAVDNAYITNNAAQVDCSLPASSSVGDTLLVKGYGAGGWKISQGSGQSIRLGNQVTTTGASGYLESANQYDSVELVCVVANTEWIDIGREGNITYA